MHFEQKTFLRERERRKARVFGGEEGLLCKSFHCSRSFKRKEGKRVELQVQRNLRYELKP